MNGSSKLALCLFAATYLARRRAPRTFGELMKPLGALTLIFGGLIVIEPDLGTTITLCGMMLAIFLVAGVPLVPLVGATLLAVGVGLLAIWVATLREPRRGQSEGLPEPPRHPHPFAEFGRELMAVLPPQIGRAHV